MPKFSNLIGRLVLVGLLAISMCGIMIAAQPNGRAQSAPPVTAGYVPASAVLYVAIDTHVISPQWIQTVALTERLGDGAGPEVIAGSLLQEPFQSDLDINVTPFIGGEIAMVFLGAASLLENSDPDASISDLSEGAQDVIDGLVIVAVPSNLVSAAAELDRALQQEAAYRGVDIEQTDYRDSVIQFVPGDAANARPGVALVQVGDALVIAMSPQQLEPIIDRALGDGESIAEIDGFEAASAAMPDDRIAFGLLNGPALVADSLSLEGFGASIEAFVPGGANGVTAFAVSSQADGMRVDTRTVSGDDEPIRTYGEHFDSSLIANLPADTQVAISGSDLAGTQLLDGALSIAFTIVMSLFGNMFTGDAVEATPEPLPMNLDASAAAAYALINAFLGVDLRSDFVELLDGEFLLGVWNTGGPFSDPAVGFIAESSDAATVEQTLSSLTLAAGFLLGTATTSSAAGATEIEVSGGSIDIGTVGDNLVIGYGGGGDALMTIPESSLIETPLFETVTEPLPDDRSLLIYVNAQALEEGAAPARVPGMLGLTKAPLDGPAFAFVTFNDGDDMGGQGYFYIPEP